MPSTNSSIQSVADCPWMVALFYEDTYIGGGALIAPDWVLTAGHCVYGRREKMSLRIAPPDLLYAASAETHQFDVTKDVTLAPGINPRTLVADLALIRLPRPSPKRPVPFDDGSPVADKPKLHDIVTAVGWGKHTLDGFVPLSVGSMDLEVLDRETCYKAYGPVPDGSAHTMLCVRSGIDDTPVIYRGDSGNPVLLRGIVVALISLRRTDPASRPNARSSRRTASGSTR